MSKSIKLTLYTQYDCPYCVMMKNKLKDWGYDFDTINISEDLQAKAFLRLRGHRTVPQLYWNNTHLNRVDTAEFTQELLEKELDYESYVGGPESFG